jgi:hypothetical protein
MPLQPRYTTFMSDEHIAEHPARENPYTAGDVLAILRPSISLFVNTQRRFSAISPTTAQV